MLFFNEIDSKINMYTKKVFLLVLHLIPKILVPPMFGLDCQDLNYTCMGLLPIVLVFH